MTVQTPKKKSFYDSATPVATKAIAPVTSVEPFPETEEVVVELSDRAARASQALQDAQNAFGHAGIECTSEDIRSLAISLMIAEDRQGGYSAPQRAVAPTVQTAYPETTQPVGMSQDLSIVPDEIRRLMPQGVLKVNNPGFSKTTGKPFPKYTYTDESNGRQVSAWQTESGDLTWGKIGPIYVPKSR